MRFNCEQCGDVDQILVDGYGCGDRLLEGVMFKVVMAEDESLTAEVMPLFQDYFEQLNPNWVDKIVEYVEEHIDDCVGKCPHCKQDIAYLSE